MTISKSARLATSLLAVALVTAACSTAPRTPKTTSTSETASKSTTVTRKGTTSATYRSQVRYRPYSRGPYWRYGTGSAIGAAAGTVIVADAIERAEIRDAVDRIELEDALAPVATPFPDFGGDFGGGGGGWDGGDFGGGDFGGGDFGGGDFGGGDLGGGLFD